MYIFVVHSMDADSTALSSTFFFDPLRKAADCKTSRVKSVQRDFDRQGGKCKYSDARSSHWCEVFLLRYTYRLLQAGKQRRS